MKKVSLTASILLLGMLLISCGGTSNGADPEAGSAGGDERHPEVQQPTGEAEKEIVRSLVEEFGKQLQKVSLTAPEENVKESIRENYGDFVSPELLAEWERDPLGAPGRQVSSPWPDRIEIRSIEKQSDTSYEVRGDIVEITSVEKTEGGVAARHPVMLLVVRIGDGWLIDEVDLDGLSGSGPVVYIHEQYGFRLSLPETWNGYSVVTDEWEGLAVEGPEAGKVSEKGPLLSFRHPQWTAEHPRQDIPIMILTQAQWDALRKGAFHIGAAPIGPKELGRNSQYVFALPARYNFAFPTGYEEVEEILESEPLQTEEIEEKAD